MLFEVVLEFTDAVVVVGERRALVLVVVHGRRLGGLGVVESEVKVGGEVGLPVEVGVVGDLVLDDELSLVVLELDEEVAREKLVGLVEGAGVRRL